MKTTTLAVLLTLVFAPLTGSASLSETETTHCVAFAAPEGTSAPWLGQAECFQSAAEAAVYGQAGPPAGNLILASQGINFCLGGVGLGAPGALGVDVETFDSETPGVGIETPCVAGLEGTEWVFTARDYDDTHHTGTYLDWYIGGTCEGVDWLSPSMPAGWNDRVSSAYSVWGDTGCESFVHYEHTNYGGESIDCYDCVVMDEGGCGWWDECLRMNDKTSSIRLSG